MWATETIKFGQHIQNQSLVDVSRAILLNMVYKEYISDSGKYPTY
jgi:hypothetical protein